MPSPAAPPRPGSVRPARAQRGRAVPRRCRRIHQPRGGSRGYRHGGSWRPWCHSLKAIGLVLGGGMSLGGYKKIILSRWTNLQLLEIPYLLHPHPDVPCMECIYSWLRLMISRNKYSYIGMCLNEFHVGCQPYLALKRLDSKKKQFGHTTYLAWYHVIARGNWAERKEGNAKRVLWWFFMKVILMALELWHDHSGWHGMRNPQILFEMYLEKWQGQTTNEAVMEP